MTFLWQKFCGQVGAYCDGLAVVESNGEWFHETAPNVAAYPERYAKAEYFQNGSAWVKEKNGRWKRINRHGKEIKGNVMALSRVR